VDYPSIAILAERRRRIAWMTGREMFAREIAHHLGLTTRTVQRHQAALRHGIAPKHPGPQIKRSATENKR
jgi:transposase